MDDVQELLTQYAGTLPEHLKVIQCGDKSCLGIYTLQGTRKSFEGDDGKPWYKGPSGHTIEWEYMRIYDKVREWRIGPECQYFNCVDTMTPPQTGWNCRKGALEPPPIITDDLEAPYLEWVKPKEGNELFNPKIEEFHNFPIFFCNFPEKYCSFF